MDKKDSTLHSMKIILGLLCLIGAALGDEKSKTRTSRQIVQPYVSQLLPQLYDLAPQTHIVGPALHYTQQPLFTFHGHPHSTQEPLTYHQSLTFGNPNIGNGFGYVRNSLESVGSPSGYVFGRPSVFRQPNGYQGGVQDSSQRARLPYQNDGNRQPVRGQNNAQINEDTSSFVPTINSFPQRQDDINRQTFNSPFEQPNSQQNTQSPSQYSSSQGGISLGSEVTPRPLPGQRNGPASTPYQQGNPSGQSTSQSYGYTPSPRFSLQRNNPTFQQGNRLQSGNEQANGQSQAGIVSQSGEIRQDGSYSYGFRSANGIYSSQTGLVRAPGAYPVVQGSYSYIAPDGTPISTQYYADETGFHPQGSHLPTPPPYPAALETQQQTAQQNPSAFVESN